MEVGQALIIVFRNRLDFPANLVLDGGLELTATTDDAGQVVELGAPVPGRAPGAEHGGTVTYRYLVLDR